MLSANVHELLWIRNCRHALDGLALSRRTLMQQRAAGGRHGRHLESMTSYQKFDLISRSALLMSNPAKFHPDPI